MSRRIRRKEFGVGFSILELSFLRFDTLPLIAPMTSRETYRKLVWPNPPLFHQPFWLDAVAKDEWDAVIIEENKVMKAYYLFAQRKSLAGSEIYMPELTQFLGPSYR